MRWVIHLFSHFLPSYYACAGVTQNHSNLRVQREKFHRWCIFPMPVASSGVSPNEELCEPDERPVLVPDAGRQGGGT